MNSKSFLHFNNRIIIILFLFCSFINFSQTIDRSERIEILKHQLYEPQNSNNIKFITKILFEIFELDSTDIVARKQLKQIFNKHFDEFFESKETINSFLNIIKDNCELPLIDLIIFYLNLNDVNTAWNYLEKFHYCDQKASQKNLKAILKLKSEIDPKVLYDFIISINQNSDTEIKTYSAYLAYKLLYEYSISLSEICQSLSINKELLDSIFVPNSDSILIFLAENQNNFNPILFENFIKAIQDENEPIKYTFQQLIKSKKEFFYSYQINDRVFLENFVNKYSKTNLEWKFNFEDISKLNSLPKNEFFKPILKIISNNYKIVENNSNIYNLGKIFIENGLNEECIKIFNKIKYYSDNSEKISQLIPLIFISYFNKNETLFKIFTKDFFINSENEDLLNLKSEYEWWIEHGYHIDLLDKALTVFCNDTTQFSYDNQEVINNEADRSDQRYYALIIAVEDYEDDNLDLKYPVRDATELIKILVDKYCFDIRNIYSLEDPTRSDIIRSFTELRSNLKANDNLLIFYAGHGNWDDIAEQGYWLPSDSKLNDLSHVITNTEITAFIKSIKNKHTLLISDACFSGSIFKTRDAFLDERRDIEFYLNKKARKAITSGALTPVPDKSVFIEYLLKALRENNKKQITSEELFLNFREAVINNSPLNQRPLFGNINDSGDEGGDFVFIQK